ncbi:MULTISPECIES: putative quinol monooxygenase [unclassified Microbacterium]|uniref:putative quinol monooxygenase n=1 Tax=unclassified Microbacterium TaxID=2609290 RepID=UPI00097F2D63|nr:putative quinol monooxygenase [Microbacterium sp. JB110]SJM62017.1 hypothetical protein CZ774_11045 [Frigoribacterium sp. JB110]
MADHGTAGVLTAVVTMTVKPDREEDYLAFVTGVMETVHREEPDVLLYVMHRHPQLPHTFVWVERYASRAALEAHSGSVHMAAAFQELPQFLTAPPEILELEQSLPA